MAILGDVSSWNSATLLKIGGRFLSEDFFLTGSLNSLMICSLCFLTVCIISGSLIYMVLDNDSLFNRILACL